jgi:DNA repair exonuclease SbcCD nuclease subunit
MKTLYTADWHLTSLPDDEYRWGVFPWLQAYATNEPLDAIWVMGDLTERKDEHPAELVLRLCEELGHLAELCPVYIFKGNHDYLEESRPFFSFLERHEGLRYFSTPTALKIDGLRYRVMPHAHDWRQQYRGETFERFDRVLFHQALRGAVGSNGHEVQGMRPRVFDTVRRDAHCLGGDIHKPQQVGKALYVGSPHPVNFGDEFRPGAILERDGELRRIYRTTIKKVVLHLNSVEEFDGVQDLSEADRARVTLHLPRSEFVHRLAADQTGGACRSCATARR